MRSFFLLALFQFEWIKKCPGRVSPGEGGKENKD
ncbi:MAG: hypothetical protein H6Q64_1253 [Firmicutes bacterium]|nr:hypothetical protein [Bacillota bacterium]